MLLKSFTRNIVLLLYQLTHYATVKLYIPKNIHTVKLYILLVYIILYIYTKYIYILVKLYILYSKTIYTFIYIYIKLYTKEHYKRLLYNIILFACVLSYLCVTSEVLSRLFFRISKTFSVGIYCLLLFIRKNSSDPNNLDKLYRSQSRQQGTIKFTSCMHEKIMEW